MESIIKGLLYLFALIAVVTGPMDMALSLSSQEGFGSDLSQNGVNDPALDNAFRFMSAVWIGAGLVLYQSTRDFPRYWPVLSTLLWAIAVGGLGRIYSIYSLGWTPSSAGQALHSFAILVECVACPGIALYLQSAFGGKDEELYQRKNK